jgi:phosphatidate cytidylyltransferase
MISPHAERWITAIVAAPILFGVIAFGDRNVFFVFIAVVSLAAVYEYNRMAFGEGFYIEKTLIIIACLFFLFSAFFENVELVAAVAVFSVMASLILNLLSIKHHGYQFHSSSRVVLGIMYVPLLMTHFIFIRDLPSGPLWVFYVLAVAFTGDVAAYYVGRAFGKKKFFAEVSPGKTVEGTLGLILGSIIGSAAFVFFFPLFKTHHAVFAGFFAGIIGQLGDLAESVMKREAGIKDSGRILPGHGGILDRLDCLMFIVPFIFYYKEFIAR